MLAGRNNIINDSNKHYNTPPNYINLIHDFFGVNGIELDPCSNEFSMVDAKINIKLPDNGLLYDWNNKNVFVNPPYGRSEDGTTIKNWIEKGIYAYKKQNSNIIFLIPVATNTQHFKLIYENATGICFLYDTRLKFWLNGEKTAKGCSVSCCLVLLGNDYDRFKEVFSNNGKCFKVN